MAWLIGIYVVGVFVWAFISGLKGHEVDFISLLFGIILWPITVVMALGTAIHDWRNP